MSDRIDQLESRVKFLEEVMNRMLNTMETMAEAMAYSNVHVVIDDTNTVSTEKLMKSIKDADMRTSRRLM